MTEAYPLHWPPAWPRERKPKEARFKTKFAIARDGLLDELRMLSAKHIVISTNVELRLDGLPYANRREPADSGVAVYFMLDGVQQCIPCDKWKKVKDNIQAVRLTVQALRGLERWGSKGMVNAAFSGFAQLSDGSTTWHDVLGVRPNASSEEVKRAYRNSVKKHHPDRGGDPEQFAAVKSAYDNYLAIRHF